MGGAGRQRWQRTFCYVFDIAFIAEAPGRISIVLRGDMAAQETLGWQLGSPA
jgi:hypothetical protein